MIFDIFGQRNTRNKIKALESRVFDLEKKLNHLKATFTMNLIRVKNNDLIGDKTIMELEPYIDISAFKAYEYCLDENKQYFIIDVERPDYERPVNFKNITFIPLTELEKNISKIPTRTSPLFVISEDGIKSIHACEILSKKEFYNCYNISGGYEKWPKPKVEGLDQELK